MVDLACAIEKTKKIERENCLEQIKTALTSTTVRQDVTTFEELKNEVGGLVVSYIRYQNMLRCVVRADGRRCVVVCVRC